MNLAAKKTECRSTMTKCYQKPIPFTRKRRRQVEVDFDGGDISSNGCLVFISRDRQVLGTDVVKI